MEVRVERISSEDIEDGRSIAHFTVRSDLVNGIAQRRLSPAPHKALSRALPRALTEARPVSP